MENFKNKIKENQKSILIVLGCILFTSIVVLFIYQYTGPRSELKILNSIANKINVVNSSLDKCIDDLTIDTKVTVGILEDNINTLEQIKGDLSNATFKKEEIKSILPKFISCIDSTQNLYKSCIDSLTYQNNSSLTEIVAQIDTLQDDCVDEYSELNNLGIDISFSKNSSAFFDNLTTYLTTLDKITKQQEIKTAQGKEFMKKFNSTITSFSGILQDLQPAITKVREDNRSIDVLIDDISQKESKFKDIKSELNYISVPEGFIDYYTSINDIFATYTTYLSTMKTALIYEKSSSSYEENKKNIDKNYSNAYSKYHDVKVALDTLVKSLEDY